MAIFNNYETSKEATDLAFKQFRALLDLFMCSDPWPVHNQDGVDNESQEYVERFLNVTAQNLKFTDWVDAYHNLKVE